MPDEIVLKVTLKAGGRVSIEGPLDNRMLCYGMLGMATELVVNGAPRKNEEESRIVVPTLVGPGIGG
jgi:hypothetical protein